MDAYLETLKDKLRYLIEDGNCSGCPYAKMNSGLPCCELVATTAKECIERLEGKTTKESVDHPDHYRGGKYECIEVMTEIFGVEETRAFCKLNAFKYLWRAGKKGSQEQDIAKAKWYLSKHKELGGDK